MRSLRVTTYLLALCGAAVASITIIPGGDPKPYTGAAAATSASDLFRQSLSREFNTPSARGASVILSSYDNADASHPLLFSANGNTTSPGGTGVRPSADSFVRGAIQAWGEHLHLAVRPDEVWFSVLAQLSLYMLAHADDAAVRALFVATPPGAERETVYVESVTWTAVLAAFGRAIQARVRADWLLDWLQPGFSTSTAQDAITANVLMMGLTKAYFSFEGGIICGLPSATLLGTEADWAALLAKVDRLPDFGPEPAAFARRLRPVLARFVASFRKPDDPATRAFWNQIVSARRGDRICGGPPFWLSGWITAFVMWDERGRALFQDLGSGGGSGAAAAAGPSGDALRLDDTTYPELDIRRLPLVGYATAPFVMRDFAGEARFEARVAAGALGKLVAQGPPDGFAAALSRGGYVEDSASSSSSVAKALPPRLDPASPDHYTLTPLSAWLVYGPVPATNGTSDDDARAGGGSDAERNSLPASIKKWAGQGVCSVGF